MNLIDHFEVRENPVGLFVQEDHGVYQQQKVISLDCERRKIMRRNNQISHIPESIDVIIIGQTIETIDECLC